MDEIQQIKQRLDYIENVLADFAYKDRYVVQKTMQFLDGRNIQVAKGTGTKIGTEATQKLGFFGKTPIVQVSAIAAPAGGATQDAEARTAISLIKSALTNLGLTA